MSRRITPTYILLNQVTLATATASVTFSSIPQNYGDLVLVVSGAATSSTIGILLRMNGDTGSNYTSVVMQGIGTAAQAGPADAEVGVFTSTQSQIISQIIDYSMIDKHKTYLSRSDGAADRTRATVTRWANTAAITSVTVITNLVQMNSGTTLSLYGVHA